MNMYSIGTSFSKSLAQTVKVNRHDVNIISKISEGGYAIVYKVEDVNRGNQMALKKIFLKDKETEEAMKNEVRFWKE